MPKVSMTAKCMWDMVQWISDPAKYTYDLINSTLDGIVNANSRSPFVLRVNTWLGDVLWFGFIYL